MDYHCYHIAAEAAQQEIVLAFLSELPFDTFEEHEQALKAYLPSTENIAAVEAQMSELSARLGFAYTRELLPYQNWNEVWESNFQPIKVGSFCGLRAAFHPSLEGVAHEIIIDPEMAFGTGHHATTYMMIEQMEQAPIAGQRVLDYGCGTGVLAILAAKLGAAAVDAVDIEPGAYERTITNAHRNGTPSIKAYLGTLENVPASTYGLILANINRNVILDTLDSLHDRLDSGGVLLASGILAADRELMLGSAAKAGFSLSMQQQREDWCCFRWLKA